MPSNRIKIDPGVLLFVKCTVVLTKVVAKILVGVDHLSNEALKNFTRKLYVLEHPLYSDDVKKSQFRRQDSRRRRPAIFCHFCNNRTNNNQSFREQGWTFFIGGYVTFFHNMVPHPIDYEGKKTPLEKSLDDDDAHNKRASAKDIGSCHRRGTSFESHLGSNSSFGQGVPDNEDEGKTKNLQMTDEKKQVGICPSNEDNLDSSLHSLFDVVTIVQPDELGSSLHSLFDEAPENQDVTIPLRQWLINDAQGNVMTNASIMRKITVSYALARLVQHAPCHELERTCSIDNFDIRVSNGPSYSCGKVMGLNLLNPHLHLQIESECCNLNNEDITGLKVTSTVYPIDNPIMDGDVQSTRDENMICHFLGLLLHNLFSGDSLVQSMPLGLPQENENNEDHEPSTKKGVQLCMSMILRGACQFQDLVLTQVLVVMLQAE